MIRLIRQALGKPRVKRRAFSEPRRILERRKVEVKKKDRVRLANSRLFSRDRSIRSGGDLQATYS